MIIRVSTGEPGALKRLVGQLVARYMFKDHNRKGFMP